jgi:hypothetical protein
MARSGRGEFRMKLQLVGVAACNRNQAGLQLTLFSARLTANHRVRMLTLIANEEPLYSIRYQRNRLESHCETLR